MKKGSRYIYEIALSLYSVQIQITVYSLQW